VGDDFRRLIRVARADLLYYSGLLRLWRRLRHRFSHQDEVCILGLHRVLSVEDAPKSHSLGGIVLREETFAQMLEYLDRNYSVIPCDALLTEGTGHTDASRPVCLLTFDDGWLDTFTTAYRWLKKFEMPATVFVTTGLIDTLDPHWVEKLARSWKDPGQRAQIRNRIGSILEEPGHTVGLEEIVEYLKHLASTKREQLLAELISSTGDGQPPLDVDRMMSWDQVAELSRGGWEIGAHTLTHPLLVYENDATIERELRLAKQTVEARLGKRVRTFAYPNGNWDERVRQWVIRAGYECAFTTQSGWHNHGQDPFTIRRILLHEGNVTGWGGKFSPAMLTFTLARAR